MLKHKIIILTCLLISFNSVFYSQSGWVDCSPTYRFFYWSLDFVNNNTGYVLDVAGRVIKTTNAGVNWAQTCSLYSDVGDIDFVDEQTGFICGDTYCSILKTTDGGHNWQTKAVYPFYIFDIDFINQSTGFAVGEGTYIVKTTNCGDNWDRLYCSISADFYSISVLNSLTMFVSGSRIIKTTNGGINWIDITPGPINNTSFLTSIYFANENSGCAATFHNIYSTTNSGVTWSVFNGSVGYHDVFFTNQTTGYVCGDNGTILKTTNNGLNWSTQPTPNDSIIMMGLFFNDINTGYCVSQNGIILKTTNGGEPIGIKHIGSEVPALFTLSQNYPNPFNPFTKIKFDVPLDSRLRGNDKVTLKIYDALGREAVVLVNEQLTPGTYEVEWDASNNPSGVYFYRLISGDYIETKKMILLK